MHENVYPFFAALAFALLLGGFALRQRGSKRHALLMGSGMAIDLLLVFTLEFTKNAVATALGGELTAAQHVHVTASTLAVVFYFPVLAFGWVRLSWPSRANLNLKIWHRRLGYAALVLRAIGFLFMFAMLGRSNA